MINHWWFGSLLGFHCLNVMLILQPLKIDLINEYGLWPSASGAEVYGVVVSCNLEVWLWKSHMWAKPRRWIILGMVCSLLGWWHQALGENCLFAKWFYWKYWPYFKIFSFCSRELGCIIVLYLSFMKVRWINIIKSFT